MRLVAAGVGFYIENIRGAFFDTWHSGLQNNLMRNLWHTSNWIKNYLSLSLTTVNLFSEVRSHSGPSEWEGLTSL